MPRDAKLLSVTPEEYHRLSGFSASLATTLLNQSPLHALAASPEFGGGGGEGTKETDRGTICHHLVLGCGQKYEVLDFDDWRKKVAQEARDAAVAAGKVPVLKHTFDGYLELAARVTENLADYGVILDGKSEQAVSWVEDTENGEVACRSMFDHVWLDRGRIIDLKFVRDASPEAVARSASGYGYDIQAAGYTRALGALRPEWLGRIKFSFAFCETEAPYAMFLCEPDGLFREIGAKRWRRAVERWALCKATQEWPGYEVGDISLPQWAAAKEML
jgi:hypothetical protein